MDFEKICIICGKKQKLKFKYKGYHYYRCQSCGLLSTYPLPESSTIEKHYFQGFDEGNYQLLQRYIKHYISVYEKFVRIIEGRLRLNNRNLEGLRVLDVGCFTGDLLELLKDKGADVYGLELQSRALEVANQKLPGRVFKADIYSNDLPQFKFDIITMLGLIEHVIDPIGLLKRSSQLLKRGGIMVIQTPNSACLLSKILGRYWPPYAPVEHIHLFSKKSLYQILCEHNFKNITFKQHWKKLPVAYVYAMSETFGPEFYKLFEPFYKILPGFIVNRDLPFYVGEIIALATKDG